ncbi:hypothetical protein DY000_02009863 [Brassica cretica]|uniref:Uncharacterized protein n=1 Tax=Brassica cretica TaxID=69181 RepID=A0ABQ7C2T6_BRACR|nr:hypothetical protein DY000_02009863 [Brassica cretica]
MRNINVCTTVYTEEGSEHYSSPWPKGSVTVSIGVFRGTWRLLGSKKEWKVLFDRVEHRSGQRERPTTPAPDETKSERRPAAGLGSRSEPNSSSITFESWSDQDGARSVIRA